MSEVPLSQHHNQADDTLASATSTVLSHCKAKLTAVKMGLFAKLNINMSDPFVLSWNISTLVTLLLPLLAFTTARLTNQEEWYNQQNQNQDNGEQNDQNGQNYNDNPYANPDNYDQYGNFVGPTHWWQFWKKNNSRNNYNGEGGEGGEGNDREWDRTPWWCK